MNENSINIKELEKTATEVIKAGFEFLVIINGEFYSVTK